MRWSRRLLLLAAILAPHGALANTEIVNFGAPERTDALVLRGQAPTLRPRTSTHWTLARAPLGTPPSAICPSSPGEPCPYEMWFALDLPETGAAGVYERLTLRLSWAASTPTHFTLDVLDPRPAAALFLVPPEIGAPPTRRKYARVRAVDEGVRTPGPIFPEGVEFILTLEPLLLGALPASLLPFLLVAGAVLAAIAFPGGVLTRVQRYVEGLAQEARREVRETEGKLKEQ
ncbi:hypothetical protein C8R47DRAFT_979934 [Mycena vitilis]|nr:hypothetical protein C8R47DRAFT_979934 [Mycena vitilis]